MKSASNFPKHFILILTIALVSLPGISLGQELVLDLKKVASFLADWTDAHNKKNLGAFKRMYADEVTFYSQTLPKGSCIDIKSKQLKSKKYLYMEIITKRPMVTVYSTGIIKVTFKIILSERYFDVYDSYLLLKQVDGNLLIIGESDLLTDKAAKFSPDIGTELKRSLLPDVSHNSVNREQPATDTIVVPYGSETITTNSIAPGGRSAIVIISAGMISVIVAGYVLYRVQLSNPTERKKTTPNIANSHKQFKPQNDTSYVNPKPSYKPPYQSPRDNLAQVQSAEYFKKQGDAFERFIVARFSNKAFTLLDWRGDKVSNGISPKSNTYPDLEIEFRFADLIKIFAVECKYRKNLMNGVFKLNKRQYNNYIEFAKSRDVPVYIALGLGDDPNDPKDLFIIPLNAFDNDGGILYNEICNYYDNPKYKFYYEPKLQRLRYFRKFK